MTWTEKPTDPFTASTRTAFTPVVKLGGSTTGITYTTATGLKTVTKDGICFFSINIVLLSKGAQTGAVTIEGLADDVLAGFPVGLTIGKSLKVVCAAELIATMDAETKVISLFDRILNGSALTAIDNADLSDDSSIQINGWYFVATA